MYRPAMGAENSSALDERQIAQQLAQHIAANRAADRRHTILVYAGLAAVLGLSYKYYGFRGVGYAMLGTGAFVYGIAVTGAQR